MEKKFHLLPLFKYRREIPISTDELGARRIITLEQNTLSIFSHYDKTYPKHFIRSQQTTLTTHVFVTVVENSPQKISIRRGIGSLFEIKGFSSECVCQGNVVCDEEVVEINVIGHTPKLETNTTDWSHPERMGILEEIWIGNKSRLPLSLIAGVVDHGE